MAFAVAAFAAAAIARAALGIGGAALAVLYVVRIEKFHQRLYPLFAIMIVIIIR